MSPSTAEENNKTNENVTAEEFEESFKTLSENIANDVDEYIDSINFTNEQKDIVHRIVCQFVAEYIVHDYDESVVVSAVDRLLTEIKEATFRECCDIIYHVVKYIPTIDE